MDISAKAETLGKPVMARRTLTMIIILLCSTLFVLNPSGTFAQNRPVDSGGLNKDQSSTLKNSDQLTDINDIKGIEKIRTYPGVLGYVALALVFLTAITACWILWNKHKRKIPEYTAVVSPEETALGLLEDISELMDSDIKEFFFRLSLILRGYIKDRFGLDAPEMTTEELLPSITKIELDSGLAQGVRDFVLASDPVKFAKQTVDRTTMERHFEFVRTFVLHTTPRFEDSEEVNAKLATRNPQP